MVRGSFPKLTAAQIVEVLKDDFAVIVPPKLKVLVVESVLAYAIYSCYLRHAS